MLQKIFWSFILIFTIYIVLIFQAPSLTLLIDKHIGISGLTEMIKGFKNTIDGTKTNLPNQNDAINKAKDIYSGAVDIKDNVTSGVEGVKDKIDDVRVVLSGAEDTINKAKQTYDDTVDFIEKANKKFNETKDTINNIAETGRGIMEIVSTGTTSSGDILNTN